MNFRAFFDKNIALFYTKTTKSGSPMFRTRATTHSSIIFSFCNIKLYHNSVAMIHFMLNNLCHPAGIFPMLPLEMLVEVIDFYLLISRTWACPVERQTSLFHLIRARFLRNNRIHHRELQRSACHDDDILLYADHICRHADTMVQIRPECIQQICYNLFICFRCIHRLLCQEQRIPHDFLYHIYPFSYYTYSLLYYKIKHILLFSVSGYLSPVFRKPHFLIQFLFRYTIMFLKIFINQCFKFLYKLFIPLIIQHIS